MSTHRTAAAARSSRRYLHTAPLLDTKRGWEENFPVPPIMLRDRAARARHQITRRRWLALAVNLLNLAALTMIYGAVSQAGAEVMLVIPLALALWLPLWYGALYLQAREAFDKTIVPSWLPYLNFALIVALPFAVFACVMLPFA